DLVAGQGLEPADHRARVRDRRPPTDHGLPGHGPLNQQSAENGRTLTLAADRRITEADDDAAPPGPPAHLEIPVHEEHARSGAVAGERQVSLHADDLEILDRAPRS